MPQASLTWAKYDEVITYAGLQDEVLASGEQVLIFLPHGFGVQHAMARWHRFTQSHCAPSALRVLHKWRQERTLLLGVAQKRQQASHGAGLGERKTQPRVAAGQHLLDGSLTDEA